MTQEPSSPSTKGKSLLASGILSLQGACPICGETIITIESNTVIFSQSHTTSIQDSNGNISFGLHHGDDSTAMNPGPIAIEPWIVIESLTIRTLP